MRAEADNGAAAIKPPKSRVLEFTGSPLENLFFLVDGMGFRYEEDRYGMRNWGLPQDCLARLERLEYASLSR
jgi:hypothetical protein